MKAVFIGCVALSEIILDQLIKIDGLDVAGIVTRSTSTFNSDFKSMESIAQRHDIPCYIADKNDQTAIAAFLKLINPEVIFCVGWSYLLKKEIINSAPVGVIGYHPALLPRNRGRHPIIWALALGLHETGSTFFIMDKEADSGDIVDQKVVPISDDDDALSLYKKLESVATTQIQNITKNLLDGNLSRRSQNHSEATHWRKRGEVDGQIDWRMSNQAIHNLVRALTRPYVGAHLNFRKQPIKVWQTSVPLGDIQDIEPGKVLAVEDSKITVKCGDGFIDLLVHDFSELPDVGEYL
jgi:methionyl-tRNA formyltransferase